MLEDLEYTAIREYCQNTSRKPKKKREETKESRNVLKARELQKAISHRV